MSKLSTQLPLAVRANVKATFDNFHPGRNGELISLIRESLSISPEGPLYLFGSPGAGKTHLLYAICNAAEKKNLTSAYLPLAENECLDPEILSGMGALNVVCIDNIDAITGNLTWETALFNLLNASRESGNRIVICADCPLASLNLNLPDLGSRLSWGLTYRIIELNDDEKAEALINLAGEKGMEMSVDVAAYIVRHHMRDSKALFTLLDRLDEATLIEQRLLTIPFVRTFLSS